MYEIHVDFLCCGNIRPKASVLCRIQNIISSIHKGVRVGSFGGDRCGKLQYECNIDLTFYANYGIMLQSKVLPQAARQKVLGVMN